MYEDFSATIRMTITLGNLSDLHVYSETDKIIIGK